MRTDTLFYQLFLTFPNLLFEILNQPPLSGYEFSSREIKELARSFDGIFLPPEEETDKLIYFVEVQYQKKDYFWWRFMAEIFVQTKVLELIQTALVYKLKNLTREEIEAMFTYDQLKDTRYFQQVEQEGEIKGKLKGKLETVPLLIQLGMTVEEIASRLDLPLDKVQKVAQQNNN